MPGAVLNLTSTSVCLFRLASDPSKQNLIFHMYWLLSLQVSRSGKTITYGIGKGVHRGEVVRDLNVDLVKGLSFREGRRQGSTVSITLRKIYELVVHRYRLSP